MPRNQRRRAPAVWIPSPAIATQHCPASPTTHHHANPLEAKKGNMVLDCVIDHERLVSDEDMWSLYNLWCLSFEQQRDHEEKLRRFDIFKENVRHLASLNKSESGRYTIQLTPFDDGKLSKQA